ncbi:MAG: hypothetical protein ACJ8F7_12390 [Gemmataceae bacterium]
MTELLFSYLHRPMFGSPGLPRLDGPLPWASVVIGLRSLALLVALIVCEPSVRECVNNSIKG